MTEPFHIDFESRSPVDLKVHGLDLYSAHPETEIISAAWAWGDDEVQRWDIRERPFPPREVREAMEDPEVERWGFNFQFERIMAKRVLGWKVPYKNSKCTMVLANMQSFTGTLEQIGRQTGLPEKYLKNDQGKRLINLFCKPQKITKANSYEWRDWTTDPEDWEMFVEDYNPQDVVSERALKKRLIKYPILDSEWALYALDQRINDRGFPIDRTFINNALRMSELRKLELVAEMRALTGVKNPNSPAQLVPWLKERGYPFSDLKKDTVRKVITEHEENPFLEEECLETLKLRQWAARTSTRKYAALQKALAPDDNFRFGFQFAGAARTNRWSGRRFQPHNLARTPKVLEPDKKLGKELDVPEDYMLTMATEFIRDNDYDGLSLMLKEPMEGLVGTLRSCIRAPDGYRLTVADLSSIETRVTAWLCRCDRLMNVFSKGQDPYIDFATVMFNRAYEEVTKRERQESKPPTLGCTYGLGGGSLQNGKRTGLWGYAESMGVNLTQEFSNRAVTVFRSTYAEVPETWYAMERAFKETLRTGRTTTPTYRKEGGAVTVPLKFHFKQPYILMELPSGRCVYYHLPRVEWRDFIGRDGEPYAKEVLSYMGQNQITKKWGRVDTRGAKLFENANQAIARDVLAVGMFKAHKTGFFLSGHVHDELITLTKVGENYLTHEKLGDDMSEIISWCPDLILSAEGWTEVFYRK